MTIYHEKSTTQLIFYPLKNPSIDPETPIWEDDKESDNEKVTQQLLIVD
jgi:hypothetical protein